MPQGSEYSSEEQGFWILAPVMRLEFQREEQGFGPAVCTCGLVMDELV